MSIDRMVMAFAGAFIVISLGLGHFVHTYFFLFTLFVGVNLFQAAFTGFCPLAKMLKVILGKPSNVFS